MLPIVTAALSPLVKDLLSNGLNLLGNAILAKGKAKVEETLGVKLPDEGKPLDPEQLIELRQLQFDHEEKLLELAIRKKEQDIAEQKMYLEDTNSARVLGAELSKSESGLNRNIVPLLALGAVLGGIMMILLSHESDVRMAGLSITMMPLAYYFGTSQGSKQKQEQLNRLLK